MALHTFDPTLFRIQFPEFSDPVAFPDALLQAHWNIAILYVNPNDNCFMSGDTLQYILNALTAHITKIYDNNAKKKTSGIVTSATIDKVSVALLAPPVDNQFEWWLSLTPYGAQLLALLQTITAGGFYFGGLPETSAISKVGGIY